MITRTIIYTGFFQTKQALIIVYSISYEKIATGEVAVTSSGEEFTLIVLGDLNGDGFSDGRDAVILSCLQNGMLPENDLNFFAGDINSDYRLDGNDYALIIKYGLLI